MRRTAPCLLPLLVLLACGGDDDGGGDGTPAADASPGRDDAAPGLDGAAPDGGTPAASIVYYWGDFEEDGVMRIGRIDHDLDTQEVLELGGLEGGAQITAVAAAPGGAVLVVAGRDTAGSQVQLARYAGDGGAPTVLYTGTRGDEIIPQAAISPDGARVAFRGDLESDGEHALYLVPAGGGEEPVRVSHTPAEGQQVDSFFWAGSDHLVFTGDVVTDGVTGLYAVDLSGASPVIDEVIPTGDLVNGQEVRRAHGVDAAGRVYFASNHEAPGLIRLYRAALDGTGLEQVPGTAIDVGAGEGGINAWGLSDDGELLAFTSSVPGPDRDTVYVLDLSGGDAEAVSAITPTNGSGEGSLLAGQPIRFSPDRSQLAVGADFQLAGGEDGHAVWLFPAAAPAGGVRLLAPVLGGDASALAFTPDGARLMVRGDLAADNDAELYELTDLDAADQDAAATRVQTVPAGGDVLGLLVP